jgi:hypothetical protein
LLKAAASSAKPRPSRDICLLFAIYSPKIREQFLLLLQADREDFPEGKWRQEKSASSYSDESEVFYIRKKLDGEVLPAKVVPEHANHGHAERRLGSNDGKLPFRK